MPQSLTLLLTAARAYCILLALTQLQFAFDLKLFLTKQMRVAAEKCESLQSFFVMHSMGGGTGSGLGTYILSLLQDAYPSVFRFVTAVFPSEVSLYAHIHTSTCKLFSRIVIACCSKRSLCNDDV
jgi:Tubulin/FtsZ family, GTPase domain